jgi:serine/threonine protein kinase
VEWRYNARKMSLSPGTKLGPYEIQSLLGAGGMGEVYRARDLRLHRDVAIKLLPSFLSSDTDRLRRFEQEARAAAALNHPNVLAVFQLGTYEGAPYLVSELLEGLTLREHLRRGPLPIRRAVDYASQIAHGLAAAHDRGIVHRDLKPENLFVTKDGRIKILDFGLAKLTQEKSGSIATAQTPDTQTEPGVLMGTVGYMAPEQVRGEAADHRADIFAFGAILYEMLDGKRAFQGATAVETMGAILKEDPPPIADTVPVIPPGLQRIVHRCLEKDRGQRFHSASDLAFALESLSTSSTPGIAQQTSAKPFRLTFILSLVSAVLVSLAAGWYAWQRLGTRPGIKETQLTTNSSETSVMAANISPDGRYLAYADVTGVYLRVLQTGEVHALSAPQDSIVANLSWFPDGTRIVATLADSKSNVASIWVLSILGGHPRKLREGGTGAAVSPDGSQIAFTTGREIWLMGSSGEDPHRVLAAAQGESLSAPVWNWDGKRIGYARARSTETYIEDFALDSEKITPLFSDPQITSGVGLPDGRLVYTRYEISSSGQPTSRLLELERDRRTGKRVGNAREIARWTGAWISHLNVTADGKHLMMVRGIGTGQPDVYVGDLAGNGKRLLRPRRLTFNDRDDWPDAWMPDNKTVLFASNRNGEFDIFEQALEERNAESLVSGSGDKLWIRLSPDNAWLMYFAFPGGFSVTKNPVLMRAQVSGGAPEFVLTTTPGATFHCAHVPTAPCVLSERNEGQVVFYALDPVKGRGRELTRAAVAVGGSDNLWDLSPDGSQIAMIPPDKAGRIRLLSLASGATHDVTIFGLSGFESLTWSADGKGWYAASQSGASHSLFIIDAEGHAYSLLSNPFPSAVYRPTYAVPSPDGRHLAFVEYTSADNVWMIENF